MNSVLLMILSDLFDLILGGKLLKEVLIITSPLAYGQFSNFKLITSLFNLSVNTADDVIPRAWSNLLNDPGETFVPGKHLLVRFIFH